jgi:endoglucanase Acf2
MARQALAKFANILIVIHDLLGNTSLAQAGLAQLKQAFALFAANKQQYPLYYEGKVDRPIPFRPLRQQPGVV